MRKLSFRIWSYEPSEISCRKIGDVRDPEVDWLILKHVHANPQLLLFGNFSGWYTIEGQSMQCCDARERTHRRHRYQHCRGQQTTSDVLWVGPSASRHPQARGQTRQRCASLTKRTGCSTCGAKTARPRSKASRGPKDNWFSPWIRLSQSRWPIWTNGSRLLRPKQSDLLDIAPAKAQCKWVPYVSVRTPKSAWSTAAHCRQEHPSARIIEATVVFTACCLRRLRDVCRPPSQAWQVEISNAGVEGDSATRFSVNRCRSAIDWGSLKSDNLPTHRIELKLYKNKSWISSMTLTLWSHKLCKSFFYRKLIWWRVSYRFLCASWNDEN